MEKWVLEAKKADFYGLAKVFGVDPVIIRLMVNRGMDTEEKIRHYLYRNMKDLHSPHLLKDADGAVDKICSTIEQGKKLVIASDFDVDGIFAGMILYSGLQRAGGHVTIKTPHRVLEGYGLNDRIVEEAVNEGAGLLITCDNGVAAFEAIERAGELGLPVVVTDHHEVAYEEVSGERHYRLPKASYIVNPKQFDCQYPHKGLCGAGVAFKLIQLLYEKKGIPVEELYQLLEYVAIATVADVMDLTDENRILVREGLKRLRKTANPGLRSLIRVNQLDADAISSYHIGFILGPCFNAAGRLETVTEALSLLMAKTEVDAEPLARHLKELNDSRKAMTIEGTEQAIQKIESSELQNDRVLVVPLEECHESLVGIIAGRLRERYNKPAIVLAKVEDGYKGSGRSIEAYHMFEALQKVSPLMTRFGGHAMAAGLSISEDNLPLLREQLNRNCSLTEDDLRPVVRIDVPMPLEYITESLIQQLDLLEPFGKGNTKPLFAQKAFRILRASAIGKKRLVWKLKIVNTAGAVMDAIFFGDPEEFQAAAVKAFGEEQWRRVCMGEKNEVTAAFTYYPSINEYMGRRTLQVVIQNYQFG